MELTVVFYFLAFSNGFKLKTYIKWHNVPEGMHTYGFITDRVLFRKVDSADSVNLSVLFRKVDRADSVNISVLFRKVDRVDSVNLKQGQCAISGVLS